MKRSGWTVGRVVGVPVVVEPGWVVMAVILVVLALPWVERIVGSGTAAIAWAVAGVALLLGSVFLHELAHALAARRAGLPVARISVTFLGGHTTLGVAARPGTSALIAIVGPVTNLVLGGAAWLGAQVVPPGPLAVLLGVSALVNVFVGAFNLVPGLPLDGGRVLESAVWALTGRRETGTVVAARAGQVVAVGVLAWVVLPDLLAGRSPGYSGLIWGLIIAATLWQGASAAVRSAAHGRRVAALDLDALAAPAVAVPVTGTVADLDAAAAGGAVPVLVGSDGAPVALVDPVAAGSVPAAARASTPLPAVAQGLLPEAVVVAGLRGVAALDATRRGAHSPLLVVVAAGRVVGVVRVTAVVAALGGASGRA